MKLDYNTKIRLIDHLRIKEGKIQNQLAAYEAAALKCIERDDPIWLDWKPSRLDLYDQLYSIRGLIGKLVFMKHSGREITYP